MSFGLLSKGGSLSLVLPGWGLINEKSPPTNNTADSALEDLSMLQKLSETGSNS